MAIDSGVTAPVAITGGTLVNPLWTVSNSLTETSGAAYTYSFTTATKSNLTSVTMTVPAGTASTPAVAKVTPASPAGEPFPWSATY